MKGKKILSLFLTFALAVTYCISFGTVAASAAGTMTLSIGELTAAPGETIEIPLVISNNSENCFLLSYEVHVPDGFTFARKAKSFGVFDDLSQQVAEKVDNQCRLVSVNEYMTYWSPELPEFVEGLDDEAEYKETIKNYGLKGNGTIVTLECTVPEKVGEYEVSLVAAKGGALDKDEAQLPINIVNGKITVACKEHTWGDWIVDEEATCEKEGSQHRVCSVCGLKETETIKKKDHDMTFHKAVPATCTEDGTVAYYYCSICKKNYSDKAGTTVLDSIVDKAQGHKPVATAEVKATCDKEGTEAYWTCSVCKKMFSDEACTKEITAPVSIPKTPHEVKPYPYEAPTCEEEGSVARYECKNCGRVYEDTDGDGEITDKDKEITDLSKIRIPATGHTLVEVPEEPATCKDGGKDGTEAYYKCSVCGKLFSDKAGKNKIDEPVVIKWAHDWDEEITYASDDDKPTCTEPGKGVRKCKVCGEEEEVEVKALGHTWGEWTVTREATEEEEGERTRVCSVCGEKETEVIPVIVPEPVETTLPAYNPSYAQVSGGSSSADTTKPADNTTAPAETTNETKDDVDNTESTNGYSILEINDSTSFDLSSIVITPDTPFEIRISAPFEKFVKVFIDGKELDKSYYTVTEGSTIVTIAESFLATLAAGEHDMIVEFTDGNVEVKFDVEGTTPADVEIDEENDDDTDVVIGEDDNTASEATGSDVNGTVVTDEGNPITGVGLNVGAIAVVGLAAAGAGVFAFVKKKNRK